MRLCIPGRDFQRVGAARTPVSKGASAGGEGKLGVKHCMLLTDICCSSFSRKVNESRPRSDLSWTGTSRCSSGNDAACRCSSALRMIQIKV